MNIAEFAAARGIQTQTVAKYIRMHPEIGEHVTDSGSGKQLGDEAIRLLEKKYPLPAPVHVINGIPEAEHLQAIADKDAEIQKLQRAMIDLQNRYVDLQQQLSDSVVKAALLEDREQQLQLLRDELESERKKSFWQRLLGR